MKCDACLENEVPINEDFDAPQYEVTLEEGDYSKKYSLCLYCNRKVEDILSVGTRKRFAEKYPLNPQN